MIVSVSEFIGSAYVNWETQIMNQTAVSEAQLEALNAEEKKLSKEIQTLSQGREKTVSYPVL